jgi:hypothetical protein
MDRAIFSAAPSSWLRDCRVSPWIFDSAASSGPEDGEGDGGEPAGIALDKGIGVLIGVSAGFAAVELCCRVVMVEGICRM